MFPNIAPNGPNCTRIQVEPPEAQSFPRPRFVLYGESLMKGTGVLEQMKMSPPPTAIKVPVGGTSKWVEVQPRAFRTSDCL
jgi:hypothetical protein